jgi:hypothetical protein
MRVVDRTKPGRRLKVADAFWRFFAKRGQKSFTILHNPSRSVSFSEAGERLKELYGIFGKNRQKRPKTLHRRYTLLVYSGKR